MLLPIRKVEEIYSFYEILTAEGFKFEDRCDDAIEYSLKINSIYEYIFKVKDDFLEKLYNNIFEKEELFDENEPQLFKDTYEGRIVISTGKIATQIGNETNGYDIKNGKEGIFIEDSHPLIELSRKIKGIWNVIVLFNIYMATILLD